MIIGAADENFAPGLLVRRLEVVAVGKLLNFLRSQPGQDLLR